MGSGKVRGREEERAEVFGGALHLPKTTEGFASTGKTPTQPPARSNGL